MKKSTLYLFLLVITLQRMCSPVQARGVDYRKVVQGKAVYDTVRIDLKHDKVFLTLQVPGGFPLKNDRFRDFVAFSQPDAAITGTYFNMSSCAPVGDMAMFGKPIHYGEVGTTMAITPGREIFFSRTVGKFIASWDKYETILAAGPTLLREGKVDIHPELEQFRDRRIFGRARRCAIGYNPAGGALIFATSRGSVSLGELANLFKTMGCSDAMNLDGGSSSALYYRGSYYANPGRKLTNLVVVFDSSSRYNAYKKNCAYTFFKTGTFFMKKGKYFQALLNFRGATAADDNNAGYFHALSETYQKLGWPLWSSWSLAKEAEIYEKKGRAEQALLRYQQALNACEDNPDALRWMIKYHLAKGDKDYAAYQRGHLLQYLFVRAALKEDLYSMREEKPVIPAFSWDKGEEGEFQEKYFGLQLKLPPGWELSYSTPSYALFKQKNTAWPLICIEAVKAENFIALEKTAADVLKKRNTPGENLEKVEMAGTEALKDSSWQTTIEDDPWTMSTLFVKRNNRVFVITAGAPSTETRALLDIFGTVVKGFSLQ
jgi:tetratricopeptide (TPR) repeat protein